MKNVPKTLKPIAADVSAVVTQAYPTVMCVDDIPGNITDAWYKRCNSPESFWSDMDRYIGDICTDIQISKGGWRV